MPSEVEPLGQPGVWDRLPLGELAVFVNGDRGKNYPSGGDFVPNGIPFINAGHLRDGGVDFNKLNFITEGKHASLRSGHTKPGDILYCLRGTLGKVGRVRGLPVAAIASSLVIIRPSRRSDAGYLYYLLSGRFGEEIVARLNNGSAQPNISVRSLQGYPVPSPPLDEQRRIAAVLGALDDKIELNRKMNRTLEEMAQAIFKSWFIDFDGVPDSEMVESELGPIPKGCGWTDLRKLLSVVETGKRPKGGVKGITEGVPSIGAESIKSIGQYDFGKTKYVPVEFFETLKRGVLEDRDVLVYKDGGKPGDFRPHVSMFGDGFPFGRAAINSHVYRLRTDGTVTQEYLYFWLSSDPMMKLMRRLGTGAAIPGIPKRNLFTIPVLIPNETRAAEYRAFAVPATTRIFANAKEAIALARLRDTLLPKLISGEIRVPEAEEAVEAVL